MEFENKAFIIGVNLRDLENPRSAPHIFADVVLIDKSNNVLQPLLYQLKKEGSHTENDLKDFRRNGYMTLDQNAFAMMGEVIKIDRKKKLIHLQNEGSVSYKHLILASGLQQTSLGSVHDEELAAGFHALTEALRVHKNADQILHIPSKHKNNKSQTLALHKAEKEVTVQNLLKALSIHGQSQSLEITNRRLYEVQL